MGTTRRIRSAHSGYAAIVLSLLILLLQTGSAAPADAAECFTPLEWQPRLLDSVADADGNFIDDALDALSPSQFSDVIVDLNDCPRTNDIQRLAAYGSVAYVGKHLSAVVLQGVAASDLGTLAADPIVAFVEFPHPLLPALTLSRPTIRADQVASTYFLDGTGVNIAIIDTGVDDGVHVGLPSSVFVDGIECATPIGCVAGVNPDDENGHGTHVAAIALGRGGGDCVDCIGIAPAAGLVDVRIFAPGFQTTVVTAYVAFEAVIDQRDSWNIGIINLSSNSCNNSTGRGAFPQIINRAVFEGMVVTIAGGNTNDCGLPLNANYVPHAASADDGIAVAASDPLFTVNRTDDQISPISMTGPRLSDMDQDTYDELKPDLAAPGVNIRSAQHDSATGYRTLQGTSMAAPHVAGCAALILQADPTMTPQSVKQLLLDTAEDKGATGWDGFWGHGLLDCFAAVDTLSQTLGTDLRFNTWLCKPGDNPPCWKSPDVRPQDPTIEIGEPNAIIAQVTNAGTNVANSYAVDLGVYDFGNGDPDFHVCRVSSTGPLVPGGQQSFICGYTPDSSGPVGDGLHACLKGEIIYAFDQDFSNNRAQHNVNIRRTESPAEFSMQVVNPTDQPLTMELRPRESCCDVPTNPVCPCPGWTLTLSQNNFMMSPNECPQTVAIEVDAINTSARRDGEFDIAVVGVDGAGTEVELTGVTAIGRLGCTLGPLDWQDKQTFTWAASPYTNCPQVFDTARGPLSFGGDFSSATCLENDEADQTVTDATPVAGLGYYYVVRVGGASPGTWNDGTQVVDRQPGLAACP